MGGGELCGGSGVEFWVREYICGEGERDRRRERGREGEREGGGRRPPLDRKQPPLDDETGALFVYLPGLVERSSPSNLASFTSEVL